MSSQARQQAFPLTDPGRQDSFAKYFFFAFIMPGRSKQEAVRCSAGIGGVFVKRMIGRNAPAGKDAGCFFDIPLAVVA